MAKTKKNTKTKKSAKQRKPREKKVEEQPVEGLYQEAIKVTAEWFRNGVSEQKVLEMLAKYYPRFTPPNAQFVIHRASQQIADQYSRDRKNVVALHIRRYNQEARLIKDWFIDEEYENVPIKFRKEVMIGKLSSWIDILVAKERVLQLHAKETQVKIYNKLNAKVKEKKVMFDLSPLTLEEKVEFLSLITKTKRSEGEILGIKPSTQAQVIETEDIEHEIVEKPNVEDIKQTNLPKVVKEPAPKKGIHDLTDLLKQALLNKAAKDFKKAGAKDKAPTVREQGD